MFIVSWDSVNYFFYLNFNILFRIGSLEISLLYLARNEEIDLWRMRRKSFQFNIQAVTWGVRGLWSSELLERIFIQIFAWANSYLIN